jgi:hypothetical protein
MPRASYSFLFNHPGEDRKLWSSASCRFLQPYVTSSLLGLNIFEAPCSQIPLVCVIPSTLETKLHIQTKQQEKLYSYVF